MRALVHDPHAPRFLSLAEAPEPAPGASQVLVEVHAVSLNYADVGFLSDAGAGGAVLGFDAAGVVTAAAADGTGPPVGARVATFDWSGAWAERRAVDVDQLAVVPDAVDLGAASAVPVAGVTALRALRRLGAVVGRRVLVTGASGGVGRFAVQLAARAGAHVVASVGHAGRGESLAELGASEVVVGLPDALDPVYGALDNVGGEVLTHAFELLEPGGTVESIGMASGAPTTIDFEAARHRGGDTAVEAFNVGRAGPFGADLAVLVGLLAAGAIDPQIGGRWPWERASEAADALLERRVLGKAILDVTEGAS